MSTDVVIAGFTLTQSAAFNSLGFIGGSFPLFHALIERQSTELEKKINLDIEFWAVKAVLIPLLALLVTAVAVGFGNVTTWLAALYLGASLPVFIGKVIGSGKSTVNDLNADQ